jgi:lipoprotein-releasing system ATP-binding protein
MDNPPLLHVDRAVRTYGTGESATTVLHGVSLTVQQGEFAAILGPSGSGKSTLLNLIGALDKPTSGDVIINGISLAAQDDLGLTRVRQEYLGFIFQFHHLLPDFTAIENVMFPAMIAGRNRDPVSKQEAATLLQRVNVGNRMHNKATDLSGGQQQRVAIARALAGKKKLILADEPTGNLDSLNGKEAWNLMREFNKIESISFLIVTHDLRLAMATDRIIEIVDGHIVRDERITPQPI